jgi:hypothetical protein
MPMRFGKSVSGPSLVSLLMMLDCLRVGAVDDL